MAFTKKNEEAVSPVIGVILMVAITVILAAVIAAFVFGMAGNIQKTKVVAATATRATADNVTVTYQGGQDANSLQYIVWTVDGVNATGWIGSTAMADAQQIVTGHDTLPVGSVVTITNAGNAGKNHIVGTGTFNDGSTQVIYDSTL